MAVVAIGMVLFFAWYVLRTYWWQYRAKYHGIEADARVCSIEEEVHSARGEKYTWHYFYVRFMKADGLETEARLLNPKKRLSVGSRVRIRYLPYKDQYAVLTEIME